MLTRRTCEDGTSSWLTSLPTFLGAMALSGAAACALAESSPPDATDEVSDASVTTPDGGTVAADASSFDAAWPDAGIPDAGPLDADPPDAPPIVYDVAYISEIDVHLTSSISTGTMGVVVNTGGMPLDLDTVAIISVTDDHPTAAFSFSSNPSTAVLNPGEAGGALSPLATQLIIDSNLVTEPIVDQQFSMGFGLSSIPDGDYAVNAEALVEIDGVQITLPMRFNIYSTPPTGIEFVAASRRSSD